MALKKSYWALLIQFLDLADESADFVGRITKVERKCPMAEIIRYFEHESGRILQKYLAEMKNILILPNGKY